LTSSGKPAACYFKGLPHVFERIYEVTNAGEIVLTQGVTIAVFSQMREGARFTVILRLASGR